MAALVFGSGGICLGYSFTAIGARHRRCGYDGTITEIEATCSNCNRTVRDTELNDVPCEPRSAALAYLEPIRQWVLVEVLP